ncbi:MAG: amino acid ABC transporter permease [Firmicutes bacterium HGW-Firmicutes-19]|jgi:polar amino acid transport system permease protein|nr:MAG: amino acid ABC transporter permease [Firmicutes bacterium HGW-Firmicutes-19]
MIWDSHSSLIEMKAKRILSWLGVFSIIAAFLIISAVKANVNFDFSAMWVYRTRFYQGFVLTVQISLFSMLLSLILGSLVVVARRSRWMMIRDLASTYVEIIRGTPLLVQIIFFYYIIGTAWGLSNRFVAGVLILSVFEGAYISEIIRGGVNSIESKQMEIARSIGLTKMKMFRLVLLPQLIIRIIPAIAGQFASVIKDSSLLSTIAIIELMQVTKEITATNYSTYYTSYIILAVLYLLLTFPVSMLSRALERSNRYEI